MFLCHDTETGRELAVKQIVIGVTNTATQKVLYDYEKMDRKIYNVGSNLIMTCLSLGNQFIRGGN